MVGKAQEVDVVERTILASLKSINYSSLIMFALDNDYDDMVSLHLYMIEKKHLKGKQLQIATSNGNIKLFKAAKKRGWNFTKEYSYSKPIHDAATEGRTEIVSSLIENGVNVNEEGRDQSTPLHRACSNGHLELVKMLLRHGAEFISFNFYHNTPLSEQ